jgi:hypothetical protein
VASSEWGEVDFIIAQQKHVVLRFALMTQNMGKHAALAMGSREDVWRRSLGRVVDMATHK